MSPTRIAHETHDLRTRGVALLVVTALSGCAPDLPGAPSFQQDVLPILAANCVRCHGAPVLGGAPETMRLDAYNDVVVREATLLPTDPACANTPSPDPNCFSVTVLGASTLAPAIALRVASEDLPMPPRFPLDGWQIDLLEEWSRAGAPRGEPRPGNVAPTATVETVVTTAAQVRLGVRVHDADRDAVGGTLYVQLANNELTLGVVAAGTNELAWDTTGVVPGAYPLRARLDDGARVHVVELGIVNVGGP